MGTDWSASLHKGLQKIFEQGEFSDLIVKIGSTEIKAHKAIFCSLSKYFDKACKNFKEAETNTIDLKFGESDVLHHMIEWLQCGEYCNGKACQAAKEARFEKLKAERKRIREEQDGPDDEARTETDIDEYDDWGLVCHHSLALDIDLFALADYYDIEGLRAQIATTLPRKIERLLPMGEWGIRLTPSWATSDEYAETDDIIGVKEFCLAIRQIYATTPDNERALRDVVANATVSRYHRLTSFDAFLDVLGEVSEFNRDIANDLGRLLSRKVVKVCSACGDRYEQSPCPCKAPNVAEDQGPGYWRWERIRSQSPALTDNGNRGWGFG